MGNKGRSEKGLFGEYIHYDEKGNKVGKSIPGLFGEYINYDNKGNKIGKSIPGLFGDYINYDNKGNKVSRSEKGLFGEFYTNGKNGKKTSNPGVFGGMSHNEGGCYVATAVYGSYDCPEVWLLRRYRDYYLYPRKLGRLFIKIYYKISPTFVKIFGKNKIFKMVFRKFLNNKIIKLRKAGYKDTPYQDLY
ncbi:MAG: CFI-box-CTERM domain-containing protein [Candidatus Coprovivens sp.]